MFKTICTLLWCIIGISYLNAQKSVEKPPADITYRLEYQYSSQVNESLDSTFSVNCIIDSENILNYKTLIVKSGINNSKKQSFQIDLKNSEKVIKNTEESIIFLSKTTKDFVNVELFLLSENGNKIKIQQKNKEIRK